MLLRDQLSLPPISFSFLTVRELPSGINMYFENKNIEGYQRSIDLRNKKHSRSIYRRQLHICLMTHEEKNALNWENFATRFYAADYSLSYLRKLRALFCKLSRYTLLQYLLWVNLCGTCVCQQKPRMKSKPSTPP